MTEFAWKHGRGGAIATHRSTIWQLANQEHGDAMALLQKKAAARGKEDGFVIGPADGVHLSTCGDGDSGPRRGTVAVKDCLS